MSLSKEVVFFRREDNGREGIMVAIEANNFMKIFIEEIPQNRSILSKFSFLLMLCEIEPSTDH